MDDFAQSREPDDLFSDDIELAEPQVIEQKPATKLTPHNNSHSLVSQPSQAPRGRSGHNNRGARRGGQNGLASSAHADPPSQAPAPAPPHPASQTQPQSSSPKSIEIASSIQPSTISSAPSKPVQLTQDESRITSVRGDRSATGPAKPTKKTEAELSELMKAMQLKSLAKSAAHARAEKDQASFLQREQAAAQKRVEERKAIREQDLERARNAQRKIKAQGGREWDSEKVESDVVDGRRSQYTRGAHGGVAGTGKGAGLAGSRYSGEDENESSFGERGGRGRGRGRGDFQGVRGDGSRGRGGRGRGGQFSSPAKEPPSLIAETDFPALPSKPSTTMKAEAKSLQVMSPVGDGDWAEEMATPVEKS